MMFKNLKSKLNRLPIFYKLKFKLLLSDISEEEINKIDYNQYNNNKSIPKIYHDCNYKIFTESDSLYTDYEKVIKIACWLRNNTIGGPGLGFHSTKTLDMMIYVTNCVCSDFAQVFNYFCVINDIQVREWGLNNVFFNDNGHSINEVYCKELKKWILIDVSRSILFYKSDKNKPLSVLETFHLSVKEINKNYFSFNDSYELNDKDYKVIKHFFYNKNFRPFLIDRYRNNVYDFFLKKLHFLPIPFVHGLILLLGLSYKLRLVAIPLKQINEEYL